MSVPDEILRAEQVIYNFCQLAVPPDMRNHYRLEFRTRGQTITVYESRPSWIPTIHRWLRTPVAQFRLDPHRKTWTLYRADGAGRWFVLEEIPPSPDVSELLNRLHLGPSGIFFR